MMKILKGKQGQSLVEILISLALIVIIIGAAFYALNFIINSGKGNKERQKILSFLEELITKSRIIAENNWLDIYNLSIKDKNGSYIVVRDNNALKIIEGKENILSDDILSDLILYLKFDENTGTKIYDFSNFSNNVELINNPLRLTNNCKFNYCLSFNGNSQYAYLTSSSEFNLTASATIMAWVNIPTNYNGSIYPNLISKGANAGWDTDGWSLFIFHPLNDRRIGVGLRNGSQTNVVYFYNETSSLNKWLHLAGVWDGAKIYIYKNGILMNSTTQIITPGINFSPLTIAKDNSNQYFNGIIDEIKIYKRALSAEEIKKIYQSDSFSRYFYVENVNRDVNDNIVLEGGYEDPSTQKITAVLEWLGDKKNISKFTLSEYLTRWNNQVLIQNDWSGGPDANQILIEPNNKFASSSNIIYQQPGIIKLNLP